MQINAFCFGAVLSSLHRDSDSTDYSYDLSYTARFLSFVYHADKEPFRLRITPLE
jgi:hypothetical protein